MNPEHPDIEPGERVFFIYNKPRSGILQEWYIEYNVWMALVYVGLDGGHTLEVPAQMITTEIETIARVNYYLEQFGPKPGWTKQGPAPGFGQVTHLEPQRHLLEERGIIFDFDLPKVKPNPGKYDIRVRADHQDDMLDLLQRFRYMGLDSWPIEAEE